MNKINLKNTCVLSFIGLIYLLFFSTLSCTKESVPKGEISLSSDQVSFETDECTYESFDEIITIQNSLGNPLGGLMATINYLTNNTSWLKIEVQNTTYGSQLFIESTLDNLNLLPGLYTAQIVVKAQDLTSKTVTVTLNILERSSSVLGKIIFKFVLQGDIPSQVAIPFGFESMRDIGNGLTATVAGDGVIFIEGESTYIDKWCTAGAGSYSYFFGTPDNYCSTPTPNYLEFYLDEGETEMYTIMLQCD